MKTPSWAVRIRGADGEIAGAGILLTPDQVLTCAHVVDRAETRITAEFVGAADHSVPAVPARVDATAYVPETRDADGDPSGDVALLRLERPRPTEETVRLHRLSARNRDVRMYGFPYAHNGGIWFRCTVVGGCGRDGQVQLSPVSPGELASPGCSGAGVADDRTGEVIGMVLSGQLDQHGNRFSFMSPAETIARHLPGLKPYIVGPAAVDERLLPAPEEELARLFGAGGFAFGHVITYGCKILGALEYLHDRGLLYCDMKPENVIHYGREIKVIDLGAIRRIDDHSSGLVHTHGYAPPRRERDRRGLDVDSDLYTVGRTLKVLAERATRPAGLAARSFEALIRRATHPEPAARFRSAAEMSRQLWEVLREDQALGGRDPYPERSTRFEPTAAVFGAALGTVPALQWWTRRPGTGAPELPAGAPGPRATARALPVPLPDATDPAAVLLGGLAADTPDRIAARAEGDPALRTVETALWLCRAYLDARNHARAEEWVARAKGWSGDYDWRIFWHRGLFHLTRGAVDKAEDEFAATYAALPGEAAPKLALGYCAEYLAERLREPDTGEPAEPRAERARARETQAEEFYEAVLRRDPTQGSAAFGLARVRLRRGGRRRAVEVLDDVPTTSRHYDAARVAAVRVLAGRLPAAPGPLADELREAAERLAGLHLDGSGSWDRLVTELREHALACRPPGGWGSGFPAGELFGPQDTEEALRRLLSGSLRRLADQAGSAAERGDLLDTAYAVLPAPAVLRDLVRGWRRTA
ncbi:hypothetical protein STENM223S_07101 [Streptomyces tendae]